MVCDLHLNTALKVVPRPVQQDDYWNDSINTICGSSMTGNPHRCIFINILAYFCKVFIKYQLVNTVAGVQE